MKMFLLSKGNLQPTQRPKGKIVFREQSKLKPASLLHFNGAHIILGTSPKLVSQVATLQVLSAETFQAQACVEHAGAPHCLSPDASKVLCSGKLYEGYAGEVRVVDTASWKCKHILPLQKPFVWRDNKSFIACTPKKNAHFGDEFFSRTHKIKYFTDSALLNTFPLIETVAENEPALIGFNFETNLAEIVCDKPFADDGWTEAKHLELSRDGKKLYFATTTTVGALELSTGKIIWKKQLGVYDEAQLFSIYAFSLSPDGKHLAVGGMANNGKEFSLLNAKDGSVVYEENLSELLSQHGIAKSSSISCFAWHPQGWLAIGFGNGCIAHLDAQFSLRTYQAGKSSVNAITFFHDGKTLFAASSDRTIRSFPLLEDEV